MLCMLFSTFRKLSYILWITLCLLCSAHMSSNNIIYFELCMTRIYQSRWRKYCTICVLYRKSHVVQMFFSRETGTSQTQYSRPVAMWTAGSDRYVGAVTEGHHSQVQRQRETQISDDDAGETTSHFIWASACPAWHLPVAAAEQQAYCLPPHPCQGTHLLTQRRRDRQKLRNSADPLPQGS